MLFVEKKYISICGQNLDRFKWKKPSLAECRCPICGDSESKKTKTRFYFVETEKGWRVYCHNCGYNNTFPGFLKKTNYPLYAAYVQDNLRFKHTTDSMFGSNEEKPSEIEQLPDISIESLGTQALEKHCTCLTCLESNHPAIELARKRQIPTDAWNRLYFTDHFDLFAFDYNPEAYDAKTFKLSDNEKSRIVIPFWSRAKDFVFTVQGRSMNPSTNLRYITLRDSSHRSWQKVFGLEKIDQTKIHYVLEGPIDSLFVPNSIAVAGLASLDSLKMENQNTVFVFDNEPRNADVIAAMAQVIKRGAKVVVYPDSIHSKDINDMVLSNEICHDDIQSFLDTHTYTDLTAFTKFSMWSKTPSKSFR